MTKLEDLIERKGSIALGGGQARIEKQHEQGKMTARERLETLFDPNTFVEIDAFVVHRCYYFGQEKQHFPGDGVVGGYGKVDGRIVYAYAQDFTVVGGSMGEVQANKICKILENARKVGAPVVGMNDSGGARIQEGLDGLEGYGKIFFRNTAASGVVPQITAIMGPSGSGKSTLTREVLFENLIGNLGSDPSKAKWKGCDIITGREPVARVLEVDQTPIGKTPRSCPATYVGFFDKIRALFAGTNEGKARGYGVGRFSFNNEGGRCEACAGQGLRTIEMSFLPDVKVPCEVCHGARFNQETLAVTWKDRNIGEILQMQVDEAVEFFNSMPTIAHPLKLLQDIGLGYLTLGQPSPTLSGGEAQRIKLVSELTKVKDSVSTRGRKSPHTLYVLDEPTVGLHMADVDKLIGVLKRLVDAGNTVIVVEHNLDLMAQADWIVDMGPEGGANGGRVVAAGTPETLTSTNTHTGRALKAHMDAH